MHRDGHRVPTRATFRALFGLRNLHLVSIMTMLPLLKPPTSLRIPAMDVQNSLFNASATRDVVEQPTLAFHPFDPTAGLTMEEINALLTM